MQNPAFYRAIASMNSVIVNDVELTYTSHFVPCCNDELHIRRINNGTMGPVVFMLHGAIENGRIFYSENGRGLAPWLAARGYDVFVADLRGRGESRPHVGRRADYGQYDSITREIPRLLDEVAAMRPGVKIHLVAHSWGGVLLNSVLGRYPQRLDSIGSSVYFGSKRRVRAMNACRIFKIELVWVFLSKIIIALKGYLPAKAMRIGADDEPANFLRESIVWVRQNRWISPVDGFDYTARFQELTMPPTLYLAASLDQCLGHPDDVHFLMEESHNGRNGHYHMLGKKWGQRYDYDHISMITHPSAPEDVYPMVEQWLNEKKGSRDETI